MSEAKKVVKETHVEEVQVKCIAISDGYMGGKVVKAGQSFLFEGNLKDGNFPLWCESVKPFESKFERDEKSENAKAPAKKVISKVAKKVSKKVAKKVTKKDSVKDLI